jgi:CheY-like chemotaxis protein
MIVCVVDDLLFSVKISTTAKAVGADVYFERTAGMALARIKEKQPSLIIFDPDTRGIKPLGFVSHVDADAIAAAREAGIDEVLARSAFADRLGEILSS